MKKKKIILLSSCCLFASILSICAIGNNSNLVLNNAGIKLYSFVANSSKNKLHNNVEPTEFSGTNFLYTELENPIEFSYANVINDENIWHMIAKDGYFYNIDPLNGVESISMSIETNNASFDLFWSNDGLFSESRKHSFTANSQLLFTFDFDDEKPMYFKFLSTNLDNIIISSMVINYSCLDLYQNLIIFSEDTTKGNVNGSGKYFIGSNVTISAIANSGFKFDGWYDEDNLISNSNPYTFEMPSNEYKLEAKFKSSTYEIIDDEHLAMGNYPQSKVSDENLIQNLNLKAGELPSATSSNLWTPYDWYISGSNSEKFSWYIDLDVNNDGENDYRGVYFTSYRPYSINLKSNNNNSYQDNNGYDISTVYWFNYEPIEWRILKNLDNDYFIMSEKILDSQQFCTNTTKDKKSRIDYQGNSASVYTNNYQYSDLRTFLNVDFYNIAFNDAQKNIIKDTEVDNSPISTGNAGNQYACGKTNDKVFALSYSDATNSSYGFSTNINADDNRKLQPTDYACCMGNECIEGYGKISLRSPYYSSPITAYWVSNLGFVNNVTVYTYFTSRGVVPALHLAK